MLLCLHSGGGGDVGERAALPALRMVVPLDHLAPRMHLFLVAWLMRPSRDPRLARRSTTVCTTTRSDLETLGYLVEPVREAPDRPGREFVFLARRP